jgi:hypothetical protein
MLLGALFLAACLVPGFVFLRVSEVRNARPPRSALLEAVELAGVGAATSLIAVTIVLILGRELNLIDPTGFADDPGTYVIEHPLRALGSLLAVFLLSCLLSWLAALAVFAKRAAVFEPAGSTWARMFHEDKPQDDTEVIATVELIDGRRLAGRVRSYTAQLEDDREIALKGLLGAAPSNTAPLQAMSCDFIIVRESQVATIAGVYLTPTVASPTEVPAQANAEAPPARPPTNA